MLGNGIKMRMALDYKGTHRIIEESMPDISDNKDYVTQYVGIWRVLHWKVLELNAKTVIEFGTREGYSTRLFSRSLRETSGKITTVDINPPVTPFIEDNIMTVTMPVEEFQGFPCDILYIDDWHNKWHLYYELNRFAEFARAVMIHDVMLDSGLMDAVVDWCKHNMMILTVYPMNNCGLAVIDIEKSNEFYKK